MRWRSCMPSGFGAWAASTSNISVLSSQTLGARSPWENRFDLKSELMTGFPFPVAHAAVLGEGLANAGAPRS